jgi:hypothetical protein
MPKTLLELLVLPIKISRKEKVVMNMNPKKKEVRSTISKKVDYA